MPRKTERKTTPTARPGAELPAIAPGQAAQGDGKANETRVRYYHFPNAKILSEGDAIARGLDLTRALYTCREGDPKWTPIPKTPQ